MIKMKNMINLKITSFMILLAFFMLPLLAQERQGQGQDRGQGHGQGQGRGQMSEENIIQRVDNLAETLECTNQQKEKILEYELDWYRKMQTERAKFSGGPGDFDREAMRAKMQVQRKLKDEKYKEILTDAQMVKYNQLMEERMQQRQAQGEGQGQGDSQSSQRQRGRN